VGRNTNTLIGMAIDNSRLFPAKETEIFSEFVKEIKNRFHKNIAETTATGKRFICLQSDQPPTVKRFATFNVNVNLLK
jgi:hypothetical protein